MTDTPARDLAAFPPRLRSELEGKFAFQRILGRGGMGVVWLATQTALAREVAIKIQRHDAALDPDSGERARFEARILASLSHPNLVEVYEFWQEELVTCLVCEYVAGEDLGQMLARRGLLGIDHSVAILRQILRGLACLHGRRVVHRDLKPANILIPAEAIPGDEGSVKLADFGLAKGPDRDFQTRAGTILGTLAYMSPEQLRGDPVDGRTDLYALGVVLHQLLTGEHPFGTGSDRELAVHHVKTPFTGIANPAIAVPAWLGQLLRSMLEKRPADRPGSALEILEWIARAEVPRLDGTRRMEDPEDQGPGTVRVAAGGSGAELPVRRLGAPRKSAGDARPHPGGDTVRLTGSPRAAPPRPAGRRGASRPIPGRDDAADAPRTRVGPGHRRPRAAALGIALLCTILAGVALFRLARPGPIEELEIVLSEESLELEGRGGGDALALILEEAGSDPVACESTGTGFQASRSIPASLRDPAPPRITAILRSDSDDVLKIRLPYPAPSGRRELPDFEITGADPRLGDWQAHLEGPGEGQSVAIPATIAGDTVTFEAPHHVRDWDWISLESITARLTPPPAGGSGPGFPVRVRLRYRTSRVTSRGLAGRVVGGLRARFPHLCNDDEKAPEGLEARELFDRVFDPLERFLRDADHPSRVLRRYRALFADPAVPDARKAAAHAWLQEIAGIHVWLMVLGHPRFEPIEKLAGTWFQVTRGAVDGPFDLDDVPAGRILALRPPRRHKADIGESSFYGFSGWRKQNLTPGGYPPALEECLQDDNIRPGHPLEPPPPELLDARAPIRLELNLWNQVRDVKVAVRIHRGSAPLDIGLWNYPADRTTASPAPGPVPYPEEPKSWKNIPVTAARFELTIPGRLLIDGGAPVRLEIRAERNFGLEQRAMDFLAVVGYRWSTSVR